jgi:hypothetical protein
MNRTGDKIVQDFGGKAQRKEISLKTKAWMGSEWILGRLAGRLSGFNWLKTGASGGLVNVVMNLWILVSQS